jgi:hypothetical protein
VFDLVPRHQLGDQLLKAPASHINREAGASDISSQAGAEKPTKTNIYQQLYIFCQPTTIVAKATLTAKIIVVVL